MRKFKKILLIDDDDLSNLIASMSIKHAGIAEKVEIATSAEMGLEMIVNAMVNPDEVLPELIFLDLNMPIINGWEFLEEYLKLPVHVQDKIAIVVLSSSVFSKDIEKAESYKQVVKYISKPLRVDILRDLHKTILSMVS